MLKSALLLSVATIGLAAPALAQDTTPATDPVATGGSVDQTAPEAEAPVDDNGGQDIVVVAQGRAQALADVPIAVSAVTAESLENTGASDIRQLTQVTPSLQVSSTGSEANGSARVRGIGTVGDNPGLESSVAVFVDGVYRSRSGIGLNELGEIDRVEVLRGPQGTLFGRNASAGLINIISKRPSFTFGANAEATYGNYDYWRLQAGVTGPITETLAARIDGVYAKRDGFFTDANSDNEYNDRDRYFIKGQLLFEPSDALSLRLIGDYTQRNETCCAAVYLNSSVEQSNRGLTDEAVPGDGPGGFPAAFNPAGNPIIDVLTDLGQQRSAFTRDPFDRVAYVTPGRGYDGKTTDGGVSLEATYDFGGATLTSITAYREYKNEQGTDSDYGTLDILYNDNDGTNFRQFQTFSQELRLQGTAFDDRLDWLVGGYFASEDLNVGSNLRFGEDYGRFAACRIVTGGSLQPFYSPASAGCLNPAAALALPAAQYAAIAGGLGIVDSISDRGSIADRYTQNSRNFAAFTHNIIHVTDQIDLTLGLRYTNELKRFNASFTNDNTACVAAQTAFGAAAQAANGTEAARFPLAVLRLACQGNATSELDGQSARDRRTEDEFTGTAVLSYKPVDDLLLYASYSRGYKAGGFNLDRSALKSPELPFGPGGAQAYVSNLQFDPEIVDAFEIGAKYSVRDFTLSIAAFRQDFKNFQLNTFNGSVFLVQNVSGCGNGLDGSDTDQSDFDNGLNYTGPNSSLTLPGTLGNASATGRCDADETGWGVRSEGVEVEANISPMDDINVNLGLVWAETKYRDELVGNAQGDPLDPALRLLPGDNLSNAPEITVTSSFAWTPEIGSSGLSALFYVDQRTTSDYNTGSDLFPQKEQDGFTVVNARVGLRGGDGAWGIEVWGSNLLNTDYTQVGFSSPFQASTANATFIDPVYPGGRQIYSAYLAEPRTYGVTLRTRF